MWKSNKYQKVFIFIETPAIEIPEQVIQLSRADTQATSMRFNNKHPSGVSQNQFWCLSIKVYAQLRRMFAGKEIFKL